MSGEPADMRNLEQHLTYYAGYHRDPRNLVTHFAGIPMIMLAVEVLLWRASVHFDGTSILLTPALVVGVAASLFYLALDLRYGLVMSAIVAACVAVGARLAALSTGIWLAWGLGLFVAGWVIQFVGHWYEGKKPAFVDDLVGLVIGPLFLVAEAGFFLGLRAPVRKAIESSVGPLRVRQTAQPQSSAS